MPKMTLANQFSKGFKPSEAGGLGQTPCQHLRLWVSCLVFSGQVLCHSRPLTAQLDGSAPVHVCGQDLWSHLREGEVEQNKYLTSSVSNANTCPLWCLSSWGPDLMHTLEATQLNSPLTLAELA